jgi:hypothetical protein
MNEFEWRRQLRELRQPQPPRRDLWADIERTLDAAPSGETVAHPIAHTRSRSSWWMAAGLAAVTVLAVGLARQPIKPSGTPTGIAATSPWKPADPRLAGAAIELTAAQIELHQAIQQAPDSPGLQRLLDRTRQQQARLRRLGQDAG